MAPVPLRSRSSLFVVVPLLLTLGVTVALAWTAWSARREHRRAAEETARDYARFAATIAASNVEAAMDQVLLYAFYGAHLAEQEESTQPVLPGVLAGNPPEMGRCQDVYPEGRWFVRVAPGGPMDVEGPLDPALGRWIADTLRAFQRVPDGPDRGNLFPRNAGGAVVAYRVRRDDDGRPVEAHALAHCFEDRDGPVFDEALARTPLLPPTVAGSDSLVTVSVTDPRGRVVHGPGAPAGGFVGVRPADASGPLEGLLFTVSVPASLADALVAGGIPAERAAATWLLLALAACLGLATLVQVHRSLQLVRARERFVANVSHELRTPLQLVLLFAQILRLGRADSPSEREEALGIIERETRRLVALVDRVLAFSGRGDGPSGDGGERVDVSAVTAETVGIFRPLAEEEGVTLAADLPADLPPVRGSADALRQILLNLLDNAVRHGPRGQRVSVRAVAENGSVDLIVDDEGPGIPPGERERVWQPFRRLEGGRADGKEGSGLGLAVVREAAESMGGRAWIADGPGTGTRVVVRLPAASTGAEEAP